MSGTKAARKEGGSSQQGMKKHKGPTRNLPGQPPIPAFLTPRSVEIDRHKQPSIVALDQQRYALAGLADHRAQLFRGTHGFAIDRKHDVARTNARSGCRAVRILYAQTSFGIELPALLS